MTRTRIRWSPSFRLIAARLPRPNIFERIAAPGDLAAVLELEALTNPRVRPALGALQALPESDWVTGPGASLVMAPFAYPRIGRFSDARHGAYYAARELETAVAEVSFHRARFAAATATPPMDFDERVIEATVTGSFADLRALPDDSPLYDPDPTHYAAGNAKAAELRDAGLQGAVYRSVRRPRGQCAAAFTPRAVLNAHTTGYIGLRWDGRAIVDAYRKTPIEGDGP